MTLLKSIICFALASAVCSHGTEHDHTADCRKAESLFYSLCSPDPITLQTIQGAPGEKGATGAKGEVGIGVQGPPGVVDYDTIWSMIDRKLEQVSSDQKAKIAQLEEKVRALEQKEGFCDVKYDGKCFWVEMNYTGVRCNQKEKICAARGGSPANIYSEEHYAMITTYLRKEILSTEPSLQVWMGMQFRVGTMTASLVNGNPSPFLKWHPGYPVSGPGNVCLAIQVRTPWNAAKQDMFNRGTAQTIHGVLCEM